MILRKILKWPEAGIFMKNYFSLPSLVESSWLFVKHHLLKIVGIGLVFFLALGIYGQLYNTQMEEAGGKEGILTMLLTSFVPTLIHVYVFTGFYVIRRIEK
jgi:hypothetical protein